MADTITTGESNKDRARLAREAGIGKLSLLAILAGAVTAFGSFAILLALVSAIAGAVGASKQPRPVRTETRTVVDQPAGRDRDRSDDSDDAGATRMASPAPDRTRRQA